MQRTNDSSQRVVNFPPSSVDEIDKALIRELQNDGRKSYADLAPRVGLSQAAVRKRVTRLIDSGTIQVVAVTDPLALGFNIMTMIGIRVEGGLKEVAETLAKLPQVSYVAITTGRFDVLVEAVCEDQAQLFELLENEIRTIPGVRGTEAFNYLKLEMQTYAWGTR